MNKRLKYFHFNNTENRKKTKAKSYTIVAIIPNAEEIVKIANDYVSGKSDFLKLEIGLTQLHPKDNYNKKLGRHYALENLKEQQYKITNMSATNYKIEVHFSFGELLMSANLLFNKQTMKTNIYFDYWNFD